MSTETAKLKSIYFVGIKGVAMTALAIFCKEKGMQVMGSDVAEEFPTKESLDHNDIVPLIGFLKSHIDPSHKPDLVIYTGAHGGCDNVEVVAAKELEVETMPHGRALGFFMEGYMQVSVAGSHGKTTTSAMVAFILSKCGRDPSYAIGCGDINGLGSPGHFGKGKEFVAEADEYVTDPTHDLSPRFLWQQPQVLVVTNIDYDHPDVYTSLDQVKNAFLALQNQEEGIAMTIVNSDDPNSNLLLKTKNILTYGFSGKADFSITNTRFEEGKTTFDGVFKGESIGSFSLHVPGMHNIANAAAAILACHAVGVSWDERIKGLRDFRGTKRRFELVGEIGRTKVYDDYAHHPQEIKATLEGISLWYPKSRIISLFQPHTFSRTKALLPEFGTCFEKSDVVLIADIYASAREQKTQEMNSALLVEEISKHHDNVQYVKNIQGALAFLKNYGENGDIIVCMGAGDIYGWGREILNELRIKN